MPPLLSLDLGLNNCAAGTIARRDVIVAAADAPAVPVDVDAPAVPIAVDAADPDADANAANDANPAVCSDTNDKQEKTDEQAAADAREDAADCECKTSS